MEEAGSDPPCGKHGEETRGCGSSWGHHEAQEKWGQRLSTTEGLGVLRDPGPWNKANISEPGDRAQGKEHGTRPTCEPDSRGAEGWRQSSDQQSPTCSQTGPLGMPGEL